MTLPPKYSGPPPPVNNDRSLSIELEGLHVFLIL